MNTMLRAALAAANGAVGGAAAAALLGLLLVLVALVTGSATGVPGLVSAAGGTTNGAASVEVDPGWTVVTAAAATGAVFEVVRTRRRR